MLGHKAILHAWSGELNKWAHSYWNSSTPSILLLWINAIYFCHWLIHRVFSCNLQKHLVNHLSRNYKIKCFFPLLTLVLGARLSGGGVREGCVTAQRVMSAVSLVCFSPFRAWRTLRCRGTFLLCFTCSHWREGWLSLHSFAWVWWIKCYIHFMWPPLFCVWDPLTLLSWQISGCLQPNFPDRNQLYTMGFVSGFSR